MITPDDIRAWALALPEVTEGTHFRLTAFKVRDKGLVTIEKGERSALVSVDRAAAEAAAAEAPDLYEVVWRGGRIFVGVRVDLATAPAERVRELIVVAWRHRAPKRLVAAHDAGG